MKKHTYIHTGRPAHSDKQTDRHRCDNYIQTDRIITDGHIDRRTESGTYSEGGGTKGAAEYDPGQNYIQTDRHAEGGQTDKIETLLVINLT